jgi:hypothetical protein
MAGKKRQKSTARKAATERKAEATRRVGAQAQRTKRGGVSQPPQ